MSALQYLLNLKSQSFGLMAMQKYFVQKVNGSDP
jgi:hypothetical protein